MRIADLAQAWFEFGLSFTLHGQFESQTESEQEGPLSRSLSHLGHCADRISVLLSDKSERETAELLDPIGDYCRLVDAVQVGALSADADADATQAILTMSLCL